MRGINGVVALHTVTVWPPHGEPSFFQTHLTPFISMCGMVRVLRVPLTGLRRPGDRFPATGEELSAPVGRGLAYDMIGQP